MLFQVLMFYQKNIKIFPYGKTSKALPNCIGL